ncbi:histidine phosphatase family protein [Prauserella cavernicola]|uniref:Histidine phosphatase family protein n=1 Tax=Prauserella cavernicola TaxID=2800127 RepID=A0A934QQA6_9PSEU|nr:histidine phosphatase family protein [Prauserella cavernicola]MBK1784395.1 histidine phosphatase family protein [Prauserella cavernicola]
MRLYLVRHAQSEANVLKALNTALPGPPLTDLGRRQAEQLVDTLAGESVAAVYASQATRAQQTAAPLAASLAFDVQVVEGVQEIFVGDLEDRSDSEAMDTYFGTVGPWTRGELDLALPGGESGRQVHERYLTAIGDLRAKHVDVDADGVVVVVSHGGAIRLGAEWLASNVDPAVADQGLLPNTGIVRLETRDDGGWHCLDWAGVPMGS